jgi:hypothetical protein
MNPAIVQQWRGTQIILSPSGQLNHRAIAIQVACDLESHLSELLSAFFAFQNPRVSHETATKELYSDGRVLCSLRKMADIALYLGLISQEQRFDLKTLSKLRDCYAHGRTLGQLADEPQLFALVTKTNLFRNNQSELTGLDQQAVFTCVKEQLILDLKERLNSFKASSGRGSNIAEDA